MFILFLLSWTLARNFIQNLNGDFIIIFMKNIRSENSVLSSALFSCIEKFCCLSKKTEDVIERKAINLQVFRFLLKINFLLLILSQLYPYKTVL